jgi:hypothetical protein
MFHRTKTAGRSGRRSVRGAALFAVLALAVSALSVLAAGTAGATGDKGGDNNGCGEQPHVSVSDGNDRSQLCYSLDTAVQPSTEVGLGTAVHDNAIISATCNHVEGADSLHVCSDASPQTQEEQHVSQVTFQLFPGGACDGTQIGADQVVTLDSAVTPDNSPVTVSSDNSTLAAGSYSYQAVFQINDSSDRDEDDIQVTATCEPFTVDPATPGLTTTVLPSNSVAFNSIVHDSSVLTGTVEGFTPTGSVTYTLFSGADCGTTVLQTSDPIDLVDGVPGNSPDSAALAAGSYSYRAHYSGDSNYNQVTADCENLTVTPEALVVSPASAVVSPAVAVKAAAVFTG